MTKSRERITISSNDLILIAQAIEELEERILTVDCFLEAVRIVFMNWSEGGNNTLKSLTQIPA